MATVIDDNVARAGFKTVGDCPNFAQSLEQNVTVPLSQTGFEASSSRHSGPVKSLLATSLRCLAVVGAWSGFSTALGVDIPLAEGTVLRFAEVRDGVDALVRRDEFVKQLSPFDRQVRLRTDRDVTEEDLLAHIPRHVLPWTSEDVQKLTPLIESLARKLAPWKLALPGVLLLVKTDGREDASAAYCRGAAIVLPENMLGGRSLEKILPHELFHVLSSHNPRLRQALYQSIGFQRCNEVPLPGPLQDRKITNPDAPLNNQFITVTQDGRTMELMPVLFSKAARYDPVRGGNLFAYLEFKLMALENDNGVRRAALVDGKPVFLEPAGVPGFAEQVGRNTSYVIHPEEILADNFVFLLNGRIDLPTPRVVEQMGKILQAAATE